MHSTVKLDIKAQPATDLQLYMSALQSSHLVKYGIPFLQNYNFHFNLHILEVVR